MKKIRAHHINCLFFFIGLGYNNEFIENMAHIKNNFIKNEYEKFILVNECDFICNKCPNKINLKCQSNSHVKSLDLRTIQIYNLKLNSIYNYKFIKDEIYKNFDSEKFIKICHDCSWFKKGVCSPKYIDNLKMIWES